MNIDVARARSSAFIASEILGLWKSENLNLKILQKNIKFIAGIQKISYYWNFLSEILAKERPLLYIFTSHC